MQNRSHTQSILSASAATILLGLILLPSTAASAQNGFAAPADGALPVVSAKLSLAGALRLADQNNVGLAQTTATSLSAQADAEQVRAALQPGVSTTTYATIGNEASIVTSAPGVMPQNIFGVPRDGFADQDVMVMVPLATGGVLQNRNVSAASSAKGARLDTDASRLQVDASVTSAYTSVLLQNALVSSAQSRVDAEQEQVRITQEKVATGRLAPVDLLREQSELADAQSGVAQATENKELALVNLKMALGVSQTSTVTLSDTLVSLLAAPTPDSANVRLADVIQNALKQRPEIAAARQRVSAAEAQVSAARGQYSPQLYAVGMADAMAGQNMRGQTGYTVGLAASLPLYDGGARKADTDRAEAALDRARVDARAAQQTVEANVAQAWYTLQAARQQFASAEAGLTAAQQDYALADLRYNAGKSTTAERLDALSALTRAQGTLAQGQATLINANAQLIYSEGANTR